MLLEETEQRILKPAPKTNQASMNRVEGDNKEKGSSNYSHG